VTCDVNLSLGSQIFATHELTCSNYTYHSLVQPCHIDVSSSSFLGSTAQVRPWPPPQNPAEISWRLLNNFLFYRVVLLAPRPTPIPEDQASVFIFPRGRVAQLYPRALGTHFSRLLRHAWVTVRLFLFPGHHTGNRCMAFSNLCSGEIQIL
jgi:hypothetical protein